MNKNIPNILVFGGTTEGKKVAWLLDQLGQSYLYSTKGKTSFEGKGTVHVGALDVPQMKALCLENNIKVIIDAAHPYAEVLHENIAQIASDLTLTSIRFNRVFPVLEENETIRLFDTYEALSNALLASENNNILALTGVQTIEKLRSVWESKHCYFRILSTEKSAELAKASGINQDYVFQKHPSASVHEIEALVEQTNAEVILSKESGESGFFTEKIEAAKTVGIPLWVVRKPKLRDYTHTVDSLIALQALIYRLRKTTLKVVDAPLASGFTTGTSVTAAGKAALQSLLLGQPVNTVNVQLPDGERTQFVCYCTILSETKAECLVIKNAGDDLDITHGEQMGCSIELVEEKGIKIVGGKGIGKVTLPGLPVPIGEPAINPVPHIMLSNGLDYTLQKFESELGVIATPFIPNGEILAEKTFNPRIGIVGGISVLGTSGRVEPYSNEAFLASIKEHLQVIIALNCKSVVLTSGLRSENKMKPLLPNLPEQAFIHFGNLVGDTLKLCNALAIEHVHIALMLGKAIKLAEGHLNTHSKEVTFNAEFAAQLAHDCGYKDDVIKEIRSLKIANAITNIIPISKPAFYELLAEKCTSVCKVLVPNGVSLTFCLLLSSKEFLHTI